MQATPNGVKYWHTRHSCIIMVTRPTVSAGQCLPFACDLSICVCLLVGLTCNHVPLVGMACGASWLGLRWLCLCSFHASDANGSAALITAAMCAFERILCSVSCVYQHCAFSLAAISFCERTGCRYLVRLSMMPKQGTKNVSATATSGLHIVMYDSSYLSL